MSPPPDPPARPSPASGWRRAVAPGAAPPRPPVAMVEGGEGDGPDAAAPTPAPAEEFETPVRPYAMVGGRTRVRQGLELNLETLVRARAARAADAAQIGPEGRRIVALTEGVYQSVAEIGAHLHLPVGVVRVVVADLVDAGRVEVHNRRTRGRSGPGLHLLESVLDGISRL